LVKGLLRVLPLLAMVVFLLFFMGCDPEEKTEEQAQQNGSKGILYEVKGGDNEVYLFGSLHYGYENMYPLDDAVYEAFEAADVLGMELDMEELTEAEISDEFAEQGMLEDGTQMSDHVPEEVFDQIVEEVEVFGITEADLNLFAPWFGRELLTELLFEEIEYSPEYGIESYFMEKAEDMEVIGLETVKDQLEPNHLLSEKSQILQLENTIEEVQDVESTQEELEKMIAGWKAGERENLEEIRVESIEEAETESLEEYHRAMYDERDVQMAAEIETLLENGEDKTYFITVGSLHLVGDNSIVELLKEEGFQVEKIN